MRKYMVSFIVAFIAFVQFQLLTTQAAQASRACAKNLAGKLETGDVIFIHVPTLLFKKVASSTGSWANHVGIVIGESADDPIIAESRIPFSSTTTLSRYLARSEAGRYEVRRLNAPLTEEQRSGIRAAALKRLGILYDFGFDLHSRRQFCSRFVYEVLKEATGVEAGDVESFAALLKKNPRESLAFWRIWYLGNIPWKRETVTPASMVHTPNLHTVFSGDANDSGPASATRETEKL